MKPARAQNTFLCWRKNRRNERRQKILGDLQITLINNLAYPGELIGRSLMIVPFMWIFYQLWKVTRAADTDVINGMTLYSTMWYLDGGDHRAQPPAAGKHHLGQCQRRLHRLHSQQTLRFLLYQFSNSMGETVFRAAMSTFFGGMVIWWLVSPPPALPGWAFAFLACSAHGS
ncbi:MAG: hypothetical protein M0C28_28600 [Candidatus Moduliflexus flocculans]|nr:hypothetical protein [Candidatus Moduliflexus flocculans]